MTEVPEHLLRRSRERREALGLGGGEKPAEGPAEGAPADAPAGREAAPAPAAAPAPTPAEPEPPPPPPPPPPYVEAAVRRRKIPVWVTPVLFFLPLWALVYAGALGTDEGPTDPVLAEGEEIYAGQCASCHGAAGGGGVGYPLADGVVLETFPDRADHIEWVRIGTQGVGPGNPYGSPDRPGGQRIAGDLGVMPAFEGVLTDEQLLAVVRYEREVLSGEAPAEGGEEAGGGTGAGDPEGEQPGSAGGGGTGDVGESGAEDGAGAAGGASETGGTGDDGGAGGSPTESGSE